MIYGFRSFFLDRRERKDFFKCTCVAHVQIDRLEAKHRKVGEETGEERALTAVCYTKFKYIKKKSFYLRYDNPQKKETQSVCKRDFVSPRIIFFFEGFI